MAYVPPRRPTTDEQIDHVDFVMRLAAAKTPTQLDEELARRRAANGYQWKVGLLSFLPWCLATFLLFVWWSPIAYTAHDDAVLLYSFAASCAVLVSVLFAFLTATVLTANHERYAHTFTEEDIGGARRLQRQAAEYAELFAIMQFNAEREARGTKEA